MPFLAGGKQATCSDRCSADSIIFAERCMMGGKYLASRVCSLVIPGNSRGACEVPIRLVCRGSGFHASTVLGRSCWGRACKPGQKTMSPRHVAIAWRNEYQDGSLSPFRFVGSGVGPGAAEHPLLVWGKCQGPLEPRFRPVRHEGVQQPFTWRLA
jgi:hypothetical protein